MNRNLRPVLLSLVVGGAICLANALAFAQPANVAKPGARRGAQPAGAKPGQPGNKPGAQPGKPGAKPGGKPGAKPGEKKGGDAKEGEAATTIKRPEKPLDPPDPNELKAKPDADGLIRFNFRGQAWADVLNWLSNVSGLSLDWQEVPSGFLNLTTQRRYTILEARDLINRHLMARGFTMLVNEEVVSVVNLSKLDPGMVPRVRPDDLPKRMRHEFVKVSFQLDWMLAEQAAEELKPMLSPHGKLHPFKNTNRLEALDAVANLREIYELLRQEQSDRGQDRLMREFPLTYVRASDVLAQLEGLLGLSKKSSGPMTPQQMQQMQRQQQQMMQQMQRNGGKAPAMPKKEADVNLVVNPRKNSVLAHAPPDKMAIIQQAIETIDVPSDRRQSLLANPKRMQVYRLHALDPATVVKTLEELGELEPTTHLEVDEKNNAIIAYASLADQMTIRQLVDRLDGSGRKFEVIRLRRLAADYVAGTVEFMMGAGEEEEEQQNSRYFFYGYRQQPKKQNKDKFRVDADVENNYLLLWASQIEKQEVLNLLVKLGEMPPEGGNSSTVRVMNAVPEEDLERILERLRRAWPSLSPNPLSLPPQSRRQQQTRPESKPAPKPTTEARRATDDVLHLTAMQLDEEEETGGETEVAQPARDLERAPERPPVNISIGPDGRLVITSQDTAALDIMEELVSQLVPSNPGYKVFRLKHADAYYVKLNLVDFFEEEEEEQNSRTRYYYYDYSPPKNDKKKYRLSERRKLKFIYDYDTNSILVQGADPGQLKVISELIALYDQPEPADSQSARLIRSFQIQYSKASLIAETIKEVYRDLLSSNDKSLAQKNPEQKGRSSGTTYIFGNRDSGDAPQRTPVNFKGKLSIGVDDLSNTLLISAEGDDLMQILATMVERLDEAAKPTTNVSVIKLDGPLNTSAVRDVVASVLGAQGKQGAGQQQGKGQGQGQQQGRNQQQQGNGGGNGRGNQAPKAN